MEVKTRPGASVSAGDLAIADKQINALFERNLPHVPHLLLVDTKNPYRPIFPHENLNTPFEEYEIAKLQYMTLISSGDRGVGAAKGDWEEEVYGRSPYTTAAQSSTSTPNPVRDSKKASQKISLGDYKSFRQTGVKPSPRPSTATPEQKTRRDGVDSKPGHSRNTSAISVDSSMARMPSSEGGDYRQNGAGGPLNSVKGEKTHGRDGERPAPPLSSHPETKDVDKGRLMVNGNQTRNPTHTKDSNKDIRPPTRSDHIQSTKEPMKHPLPARPQSPPRSDPQHKQQKRPLESGDAFHPEKRVKTDPGGSITPSNSQKPALRKHETAEFDTKPSPTKSQKSYAQAHQSHTSPQAKKGVPLTKTTETKTQPSKPSTAHTEKPLNLPPLLSPLPADLASPEPSGFTTTKKSDSDKTTAPKTPSSKNGFGGDTIIVKQPHLKNDFPSTPPLPAKPAAPFVIPRLLSPDLPAIVEAELLRLQQKSTTNNTVEARHEKARLPDTPGVARKTPRPKVGHPPKRSHAESSAKAQVAVEKDEKPLSLIVKIPYKRRQAIHIQRILALTQKPRGQLEKLEAGERLARERSSSTAPLLKDNSESEEDIPIAKSRGTKTPATTPATGITKKRPSDHSDRNEPPPKRPKGPENLDIAKTSAPLAPAFKSPAPSGPNTSREKGLPATPKKGDAMKSVAMRKVDSSDGNARTPQATTFSTPASAEKAKVNGSTLTPSPEIDRLRAEEKRLTDHAFKLKRTMDGILKLKADRAAQQAVSTADRKRGLSVGLECIIVYLNAFHAKDRQYQLTHHLRTGAQWEQLMELWKFLDGQCRGSTELKALCSVLGALVREELERIYADLPARDIAKDPKFVEKFLGNSKARDGLWMTANKTRQSLIDLGDNQVVGPWTTVQKATDYAMGILEAYSKKEGFGWVRDKDF